MPSPPSSRAPARKVGLESFEPFPESACLKTGNPISDHVTSMQVLVTFCIG